MNSTKKGLLIGLFLGMIIGALIPIEGDQTLSLVGRVATTTVAEDSFGWSGSLGAFVIISIGLALIGTAIGALLDETHRYLP